MSKLGTTYTKKVHKRSIESNLGGFVSIVDNITFGWTKLEGIFDTFGSHVDTKSKIDWAKANIHFFRNLVSNLERFVNLLENNIKK